MSRQVIIPLILLAAGLAAIGFHMQKNSQGLKQSAVDPRIVLAFAEWTSAQRKVYANPTDKNFRLGVFAKNFMTIEAHNSNPRKSWTMGLTTFADLTSEEFLAKTNQKSGLRAEMEVSGMPSEVTGTTGLTQQAGINWMSYLQQQVITGSNGCNDNYAWISAVTMNAQSTIRKGSYSPAFSPQTYIDCSANFGNYGCNGGTAANSYTYSYNWGIDTMSNYPYYGTQRPCRAATGYYKNSGAYAVASQSNTDLYNRLSTKNVITAAIDISGAQFYRGGVFTGPCTTTVNQGVIITGAGFDTSSNLNFWLLLNTWGPGWGENGTMRIARFTVDNNPSYSSCGLNMFANFPYYN